MRVNARHTIPVMSASSESPILGFIGYGNHARRLVGLLGDVLPVPPRFMIYLHRGKDLEVPPQGTCTSSISDLLGCQAIFITSPNGMHVNYIRRLMPEYRGYIFCEKIPASTHDDLHYLENMPTECRSRIHFNMNMRHSVYGDMVRSDPARYSLGDPVSIFVAGNHGLAFKEEYKNSWRNSPDHKNSIIENVSIHWIDLFISILGEPLQSNMTLRSFSSYSNVHDTANCLFLFKNNATLSLMNSYATPKYRQFELIYTNGILSVRGRSKRIFAPRDTFDGKGNFTEPEEVFSCDMPSDGEIYAKSLGNSLRHFFEHALSNLPLDVRQYDSALATNRFLLDIDMP